MGLDPNVRRRDLSNLANAATFAFDSYISLKSDLPQSVCAWDPIFSGLGIVTIIVEVQIILQLRIYAMYNRCKWLLYLNGLLFCVEIATAVTLMVRLLSRGTILGSPAWVIGSCYEVHSQSVWLIWLPRKQLLSMNHI